MSNLLNDFNWKTILMRALIISFILGNSLVFAEKDLINDLNKASDYAQPSIIELSNKNIIVGNEHGNFNPSQSITRAQMITIIVKILALDLTNIPSKATFEDVPKNHWAYPYVEAAYREGIVSGISSNLFGVNNQCTREQMTTMFVRALKIPTSKIDEKYSMVSINKLIDQDKISDWAKPYVEFALSTGMMSGTSNVTFDPKGYAKREQAAVVTHRFLNDKEKILSSIDTKEMTFKEIAEFEKSVVSIETFDKNGQPMVQGSGFFVANGLILTNYHVLEGSSKYEITTNDGKVYEVSGIVKYDADIDLAIIKTKEFVNIQPLVLGSKNMINKGEQIVTIGNPQGLQNTISDGIVSGLRAFEYGENESIDMIQITAPISNGSSGGALFNMKGYVIGVTTATSEDGSLNFAVAIDYAKGWIQELKSKSFEDIPVLDMGEAIDAYLNISDKDIKDTIYKAFRALEEEDIDAYIATVHKFNPTYQAIREFYEPIFLAYDFDYDINELEILEKSYDTANVEVLYSIKKTKGPAFNDLKILGQYTLIKYNGEWKVYFATETVLDYKEEGTNETNMGGFPEENNQIDSPNYEIKDINGISLAFQVTDSLIHPTKPIIYVTDKNSKKIYAYNYETKDIIETSFDFPPESLAFAGNEIYVALLKGEHSPYWWEEDQKGAIAIVDSTTLELKEQFDIDIDPFDIVAGRDSHIYVSSGSGQWTHMKSYSRQSKQEISSTTINHQSYAILHPTADKIYTLDTQLSPRDMTLYNISDGVFTDPLYPGGIDSPYHGDYEMGTKFKISPDGKYIFNSAGTIFSCDPNTTGMMVYHSKLSKGFIDITFDLENNRFFTGIRGGFIYAYDYSSFKGTNTYKVQGEIVHLYHRGEQLIALTKANNQYYIETVILDLPK